MINSVVDFDKHLKVDLRVIFCVLIKYNYEKTLKNTTWSSISAVG